VTSGLAQPEAVTHLPGSARGQLDAGESAHRAAEADQLVARPGRWDHAQQSGARLSAQGSDLARGGRIVVEETAGRPHGTEPEARDRRDLRVAQPRDLEAPATQIRDHPVAHRQTTQHGQRAELRLVAAAQHLDLDPFSLP